MGAAGLYALGILRSCGIAQSGEWLYPGDAVYFNMQAAALLHGELAISKDPGKLALDLAWSGCGVQQVWGLAVPAWIACTSVLFGQTDPTLFPSRLSFAIALWLTALACIFALLCAILRSRPTERGLGVAFWTLFIPTLSLCLFSPGLTVLLKSIFYLHEEVVAYGFLLSLLLAAMLLWVQDKPTLTRLALLGSLGGVAGMVRPTVAAYGGVACAAGLIVAWRGHMPWRRIVACFACYAAGVAVMLSTNQVRFGAPLEFGHSLNLTWHNTSLYSTRFAFPFSHEPALRALKELAGATLFDGHFGSPDWVSPGVFKWQSPTPRWRECYLSSLGWFVPSVGLLGSALVLFSRSGRGGSRKALLVCYCWGAIALLAAFYARAPVLSSRYLYDFAAGFSLLAAVSWWHIAEWGVRRGGACLAATAVFGVLICWYTAWRAQNASCAYAGLPPIGRAEFAAMVGIFAERGRQDAGGTVRQEYVLSRRGSLTGGLSGVSRSKIPFDGEGWSSETGSVAPATIHFLKDIECITLTISPDGAVAEPRLSPERIQVKVGLERLQFQRAERGQRKCSLFFCGPRQQRYKSGVQPVFIAWASSNEFGRQLSGWRLHRICCKSEPVVFESGSSEAGHWCSLFSPWEP
jgi:hypothetical protein